MIRVKTIKQILFFTILALSITLLSMQNHQQLNQKNMTMIFDGYDEGDFPHLLFHDIRTKEEYDFGNLSYNQLGNSHILINDSNASFGYKANPKYIGKKFAVLATEKYIITSDLEGNRIKSKEWVISNIKHIPQFTISKSHKFEPKTYY